MSKVTKVVLIVGGAMVALGIVFSVLGFMVFRNSGFKNGSSKKPEQNVVVISDSFTNIEVTEISDEVIIKPSEDGEVKVEYYDYDEIVHEVDVKGDTLTVKVKDIYGGEPWWTRIQFGFDLERIINNSDYDTRTVIYLPEDSYGSLKVNTVSGEIEVPEKYAHEKYPGGAKGYALYLELSKEKTRSNDQGQNEDGAGCISLCE